MNSHYTKARAADGELELEQTYVDFRLSRRFNGRAGRLRSR